jgi:hypothetical protein
MATIVERSTEEAAEAPPECHRNARRRSRRDWAARAWIGMSLGAWTRTLLRHRFAIDPHQWHTAALMPFLGGLHSLLGHVERLTFRRALGAMPPLEPPIFVIGHWRTGTTWLHEMLALDDRHTSPNTYECFSPNHFLLSEDLLSRLRFLTPSRRPMDAMDAGFDRPQEDEFALAILGLPSPYLTIAFPNRTDHDEPYDDLDGLPTRDREAWKAAFLHFLRRVAYRRPGRLVLKSPTHSFRIPTLLELFPEARFVHIVRDPFVVFPSTVHLWRKLHEAQGLQRPHHRGLEERVFRRFVRLHERIEQGRALVDPSRFHELRYEDLVADPVGQLQFLYGRLDLGGFDALQPRLETYLAQRSDYRTNRYDLSPALRAEIESRWGEIIRRQGYDAATVA